MEPECPGPDCLACSGEACALCGAGCWNNGFDLECQHDVLDRHREPSEKEPGSVDRSGSVPVRRPLV